MLKKVSKAQQEFANFILNMYVRNGFKELGMDKLGTLIDMKYHTISDAKRSLNMEPGQMRDFFLNMQHDLYNGASIANLMTHNDMSDNPFAQYSFGKDSSMPMAAENPS